jgi:DNA repair protein RecO (recombination protein O)
MYLTIRGLVLRVTDYKDKDALVTLLTEDLGRLTVKARGLRRKNSPLVAPCQLLAYGEFTLFEYRGSYTINEANAVALFHPLRKDLQKLALATYFAQVSELISQEDTPNAELLALVLNCLHALSVLPVPEEQIKAVFEMRCASLAGYEPDLSACHVCGNPNPDRLHISAGLLECAHCHGDIAESIRMPLMAGTLDCLRYIVSCTPKALFRFTAAAATLRQLAQVTEVYLTTQLEKSFSTLDFYKSLTYNTTDT